MAQQKGLCLTFWQLVKFLRPYPAALLLILSMTETALVAKVGQIAGQFYLIIVDRQPGAFLRISLISLGLYVCNTIVKSSSRWLSELLALRWRTVLTSMLQQHYCQGQSFYWISQQCDNPDQRIAQDVNIFSERLASIALVIAATPFQAVYYTVWTYQITSGYVILAVYTFFLVSLLLESTIIKPVARRVFKQERAEGNFRFGHMRLRAFMREVALYKAAEAEQAHLDQLLQPVLANQMRLVMWRWLLNACTTGLDYAGALLTYSCLGLLVFTGLEPDGMDQGQRAKWVSNASFATLTLIYTFTQILDLGTQISTLAGVTMRVGRLMQALDIQTDSAGVSVVTRGPEQQPLLIKQTGAAVDLGACTAQLDQFISIDRPSRHDKQSSPLAFASAAVWLNRPERGLPAEHQWMQPQQLVEEDPITRQLASVEHHISLQSDSDHELCLHRQSPATQAESSQSSQQHPGQQHSAQPLPQPSFQQDSAQHSGRQSSAQQRSMQKQPGPCPTHPHPAQQQTSEQKSVAVLHDFMCERPDGAMVVRDLSLQLSSGDWALITGCSGSGKTTLVHALAGLWPHWQGHCQLPSADQVMFLPQTPLAAPGATLLEQVIYPQPLPSHPAGLDTAHLEQLLQQVKLEQLLQRVQGLWMLPQDWSGMLSPGELQRLAIARVLYHKPLLSVLDEPVTAVDGQTGLALLQAIKTAGIAVIMTAQPDSHLARHAQIMFTRTVSLQY